MLGFYTKVKQLFNAVIVGAVLALFAFNAHAQFTYSDSTNRCYDEEGDNVFSLSVSFDYAESDGDLTTICDYVPCDGDGDHSGIGGDDWQGEGLVIPANSETSWDAVTLDDIMDAAPIPYHGQVVHCQFLDRTYDEAWYGDSTIYRNYLRGNEADNAMRWLRAFSFTEGKCWMFGNREVDCNTTLGELAQMYMDALEQVDDVRGLWEAMNAYINEPVAVYGDPLRDPYALENPVGGIEFACIHRRLSCYVVDPDEVGTCDDTTPIIFDVLPERVTGSNLTLTWKDTGDPVETLIMNNPADIRTDLFNIPDTGGIFDGFMLALVETGAEPFPIGYISRDNQYTNFFGTCYDNMNSDPGDMFGADQCGVVTGPYGNAGDYLLNEAEEFIGDCADSMGFNNWSYFRSAVGALNDSCHGDPYKWCPELYEGDIWKLCYTGAIPADICQNMDVFNDSEQDFFYATEGKFALVPVFASYDGALDRTRTVNYNVNGYIDTQTYNLDDCDAVAPSVISNGDEQYVVTSWYVPALGINIQADEDICGYLGNSSLDSTVTFYADEYETVVAMYTITFKVDGNVHESHEVEAGGELPNNPTIPTKTGYKFTGWWTATSGGTQYYDASNTALVDTYTLGTDLTLYAQWTPNVYTVTLDSKYYATEGTSEYDAQTNADPATIYVKYGTGWYKNSAATTTFSQLTTKPAYTGYIFGGFYTGKAGGGTQIIDASGKIVSGRLTTLATNATLYAKWTPITYYIKYNANGGSGDAYQSEHQYNNTIGLTPNRFTRTGYTFNGWNTKADGTGTSYSDGQAAHNLTSTNGATVNLYAQWTIASCTCTNGTGATGCVGTLSGSSCNYTWTCQDGYYNSTQSAAGVSQSFTATCNTCSAPYTHSDGGRDSVTDCYRDCTTDDLDNATSVSGKYYSSGSNNCSADTCAAGYFRKNQVSNTGKPQSEYMCSACSASHPNHDAGSTGVEYCYTSCATKPGYTLQSGGRDYYSATDTCSYTACTYSVKYNANGGSGTMNNSSHTYDTAKALTANTFTRTGYTFAGWNTAADGSGTNYADKAEVTNLTSTCGGTVNLYAKWTACTYSVKYNANGGSGTMSNSSHTYDTAKALTANAFTRTGYTFAGWNTAADGTGTNYADRASVKNLISTCGGTVNLYAKWTAKEYTVTYSCGSGTGTAPSSGTATYNSNFTPATNGSSNCKRDGYTFAGWTTTNNSGSTVSHAAGTAFKWQYTANKTFTAKWTGNTITVNYNENGGDAVTNGSCTYGGSLQLPSAATKDGSVFAGWKLKDGTVKNAGDSVTCNYTNLGVYSGTSTAVTA